MKNAVIWTQTDCAACKSAKSFLLSKGYTYEEKQIGNNYTKKDLLAEVPGARSVPQIFIDGNYIGGYQELIKAL